MSESRIEHARSAGELTDLEADAAMRKMSRRSFLWAGASAASVYAGWRWLTTRRPDDSIPWPLRRVLEVNEELSRDLFSSARLAATFPVGHAGEPRVNGDLGLTEYLEPDSWTLTVEGLAAQAEPLALTLDDVKKLPRVEMVTELKCIEGWSQVVRWAGIRMTDFVTRYPPATQSGNAPDVARRPDDLPAYVSVSTPDEGYYVGLDMPGALHPQTLLCYEMNGLPLTADHGAPLRLVIPVKYGIKNLKRIGKIRYSFARPPDYWAERGYDWFAGH